MNWSTVSAASGESRKGTLRLFESSGCVRAVVTSKSREPIQPGVSLTSLVLAMNRKRQNLNLSPVRACASFHQWLSEQSMP